MAKTKRAAPESAGVESPKQEVMTPPPTTTAKQSRVANERNEGTILQDDKGEINYPPIDSKADNTAGVLTDTRSDGGGAKEEVGGGGHEHKQQGKKKKGSKAKAKRWTRIKTKGPSKVKPPNQQMGGGAVHKPTAKQLELGRIMKGRKERRTSTERWF